MNNFILKNIKINSIKKQSILVLPQFKLTQFKLRITTIITIIPTPNNCNSLTS